MKCTSCCIVVKNSLRHPFLLASHFLFLLFLFVLVHYQESTAEIMTTMIIICLPHHHLLTHSFNMRQECLYFMLCVHHMPPHTCCFCCRSALSSLIFTIITYSQKNVLVIIIKIFWHTLSCVIPLVTLLSLTHSHEV